MTAEDVVALLSSLASVLAYLADLAAMLGQVSSSLQTGDGETVAEKLDSLIFLGQVCALGVGVLWGSYSWRLAVLAKNQRLP